MIVSVAELRKYMGGIELTPEQTTEAEGILFSVQEELERYCNRPLEHVHVREAISPDDRGFLVFSASPVVLLNYIQDPAGNTLTLPPAVSVPAFESIPGVEREWDRLGAGETSGMPFEFYVGYGNVLVPIDTIYYNYGDPMNPAGRAYIADYVGGWNGAGEESIVIGIKRVAARECERQFDDTMTIRGASQDAALPSDGRPKMWSEEELKQFGRMRRRVAV